MLMPLRGLRVCLRWRRYRCGLAALPVRMGEILCLPCWGCWMEVRLRLLVAG